jgi:hypothetical protein
MEKGTSTLTRLQAYRRNLNGVAAMGAKCAPVRPVKFARTRNVNRLKAVLDKMEPLGLKA